MKLVRQIIKALLLPILSALVLILVVIYLPAPNSWSQANAIQLISFFSPILVFLICLIHIVFKRIEQNLTVSLGLFMILVLKISHKLNLVSAVLVIAIFSFTWLLLRHLRLTRQTKIPKLSPSGKKGAHE